MTDTWTPPNGGDSNYYDGRFAEPDVHPPVEPTTDDDTEDEGEGE